MMNLASFQKLVVAFALLAIAIPADISQAQYEAGEGYTLSYTLDARDYPELFPRGPAFGARSVLAGMDLDGDGNKEFLFTTDETLAPQGPDPGFLDVFLYENTGDDTYEYVWHYTHTEGSNSLPALGYGDIDDDGYNEIYFGIPTINDDPIDLYVFEQGAGMIFPDTPTTTWDYDRDGSLDFRPAGFQIVDVDGDGQKELLTVSRTSGARELVVAAPVAGLDAFTTWAIEFEAGEDLLGGGGVYDVDVADFDNDGKNEIWVNTWDLFSLTIFEATDTDTYELQVDINQAYDALDHGSFNSHDLLFNDIDDDGRIELLFPTTEGNLFFLDDMDDVSALTGASFVDLGSFLGPDDGAETRGADIGDLDNDGMTDIVISLGRGEAVINLEYQGGGASDLANYERSTVVAQTDTASVDRFYPLRIADDMDKDGKKEVVMTNLYATDPGQNIIIIAEAAASGGGGGDIAYEAGDDFKIAWALDAHDNPLFTRGPAFGVRSVFTDMDFDGDGKKEILFNTDETLAPQGPDPGFLDIYLYENTGDDAYEHIWHYTHTDASNSLAAIAYGDIDDDGLFEIYFGIPTINDDPNDVFIFEQNEDLTFPDTPTTTWDFGRDGALDFRPAGFQVVDVDGDGQKELITVSRTSGARELVVAAPVGGIDAFTTWAIEFEAGEDLLGGGGVYDVDVADFDNDGLNEIWVNTWDLFSFTIFEVTAADTYALQVDINQAYDALDHGSFNSHHLLFNDIDDDGRIELLVPTTSGNLFFLDDMDDVSTLTGASFVDAGSFLGPDDGSETRGADIGDLDDDGLTDIVVALGRGEKVIRLEYLGAAAKAFGAAGPGDLSSYEITTVLTQTDTVSVDRFYPLRIADDLDGDGRKEVVMSNLYATDPGQQMIIIAELTGDGVAIEDEPGIPTGYVLSQNYPNPFNPSTNVVFEVPETASVEVAVYDMTGRMVQVLSSGVVSAGTHRVTFDAGSLPSGVYMITMQTPFGMLTQKAMLLK